MRSKVVEPVSFFQLNESVSLTLMAHAIIPCTWESGGRKTNQEFKVILLKREASLSYMRPCLKSNKQKEKI